MVLVLSASTRKLYMIFISSCVQSLLLANAAVRLYVTAAGGYTRPRPHLKLACVVLLLPRRVRRCTDESTQLLVISA